MALASKIGHIAREQGALSLLRRVPYQILAQSMGALAWPVCQLLNVRFLAVDTDAMGHLAGEPECFIKEGVLGMRAPFKGVLVTTRREAANPHLLDYWKPHLAVIEHPALVFLLRPLLSSWLVRYPVEKYFCGEYGGTAVPRIQKEHIGRPPVLSLSEADRERGQAVLKTLGMPDDAWFVCVHARESGAVGVKAMQSIRDVDVRNYYLAIEEVVRRGGWVLRMGAPQQRPMPPMEHVIDYALSPAKSDWMDVFLCASCRFFLGSNSGLSHLASVFGVPCVHANIAGPVSTILPYAPDSIAIPKLFWSLEQGRLLSFKEIFASPLANWRMDDRFAEAGIRPEENAPEDIRDVVIEMFDRLAGKLVYSDADEKAQNAFKALMTPSHFSYGAVSRVGRDFLRKHAQLL